MTWIRTAFVVLLAGLVWPQERQWPTVYNVYAIRYATLADVPVASLVAGADPGRRANIAMMLWLLESHTGAAVLFDAGFHSEQYMERWKPANFVRPDEAVAQMGTKAYEVSEIILSHIHWDHLDGVDLFPGATVWLQKAEYEYYVGTGGRPRDRGIDERGAALLDRLRREGSLQLIDGGGGEILPGITVHTGGRHTYASQYLSVRTPRGTVVLASDNLYMYENLERRLPIAQTFDAEANRQSHQQMLKLATDPRWVVPGHDPRVFDRFPRVSANIAAIPR